MPGTNGRGQLQRPQDYRGGFTRRDPAPQQDECPEHQLTRELVLIVRRLLAPHDPRQRPQSAFSARRRLLPAFVRPPVVLAHLFKLPAQFRRISEPPDPARVVAGHRLRAPEPTPQEHPPGVPSCAADISAHCGDCPKTRILDGLNDFFWRHNLISESKRLISAEGRLISGFDFAEGRISVLFGHLLGTKPDLRGGIFFALARKPA